MRDKLLVFFLCFLFSCKLDKGNSTKSDARSQVILYQENKHWRALKCKSSDTLIIRRELEPELVEKFNNLCRPFVFYNVYNKSYIEKTKGIDSLERIIYYIEYKTFKNAKMDSFCDIITAEANLLTKKYRILFDENVCDCIKRKKN